MRSFSTPVGEHQHALESHASRHHHCQLANTIHEKSSVVAALFESHHAGARLKHNDVNSMADNLELFARFGYASVVAGLLASIAAMPVPITKTDVAFTILGLGIVGLAWAAATKWHVWIGGLLVLVALIVTPAPIGEALFEIALIWVACRGRVWAAYLLALETVVAVCIGAAITMFPNWVHTLTGKEFHTSVLAWSFNAVSLVLMIVALFCYFRGRRETAALQAS